MFKKFFVVGLLTVLLASSTGFAETPAAAALPEKVIAVKYVTCTTCGDEEAPATSALFEGKVYFFCDEKCQKDFEKEPKKFAEKLKDAPGVEVALANVNGKCFVCEKPAVTEFFKTTDDKIAFFCCSDCKEKAKNDHTGHDHSKEPHGAHK
jgi:YHS domain-containing protein